MVKPIRSTRLVLCFHCKINVTQERSQTVNSAKRSVLKTKTLIIMSTLLLTDKCICTWTLVPNLVSIEIPNVRSIPLSTYFCAVLRRLAGILMSRRGRSMAESILGEGSRRRSSQSEALVYLENSLT